MKATPGDALPLRAVSDLRGLPVADAGGRPIGRLFGALAEADSGLLRYLDLDLTGSRRHVLVPIGHVRIREREQGPEVRLRAAVLDDLERIPTYAPDAAPLGDDYEREVLEAYGRSFYGDRYYAHPAFDHSGLYAGEHPIVHAPEAPPPPPGPAPRLELLSRSDFRVARGEPDIEGWPLMTDADLPSGTVADLVIDPAAGAVRYVVIDMADDRGAVLLPVGFLQLDARRRTVRLPAIRHDDLAGLPRFTDEHVQRNLEDAVSAALRTRALDRRRYDLPDFRGTDRRRA
jgi:hypothetical protein